MAANGPIVDTLVENLLVGGLLGVLLLGLVVFPALITYSLTISNPVVYDKAGKLALGYIGFVAVLFVVAVFVTK